MISRIWHGWTEPDNADAYEALLKTEIFPGILAKNVPGFRRIELFRRPAGDEVEFVTVMWFDSLDDVKAFAGEDYERAVFYPEDDRFLIERDLPYYDPEISETALAGLFGFARQAGLLKAEVPYETAVATQFAHLWKG